MNSQFTVETITEKINQYNNIAFVLLVASIAMLVSAIVLFITLNIPHSIRVLTGMGMSKEINKISSDAKNGKVRASASNHKAVVSWNNSGNLSGNNAKLPDLPDIPMALGSEATTVLGPDDPTTILAEDEQTTILASEETTVLAPEETTILTSEETTLLSEDLSMDTAPGFEMEEDIKITGINRRI